MLDEQQIRIKLNQVESPNHILTITSINGCFWFPLLKGGIGSIVHPPIGSIYHLYTTYRPCLLGDGLCYRSHLLGEPFQQPLIPDCSFRNPSFNFNHLESSEQEFWSLARDLGPPILVANFGREMGPRRFQGNSGW